MIRVGVATVGLMIVGTVLMAVGMRVWVTLGLPPLPQGIRVLVVFALEMVLVIPVWRWGPGKYGGSWESLGLRPTRLVRAGLLCMLGLVCIIVINVWWESIRQRLGWAGQPDLLPFFGRGLGGLLLALILGGIVAPVAEETFFRGYLHAGLRQLWGAGWGMFLSSLVFSVGHLQPGVMVPIFFMGLVFAYIYERTDSIWPCIALHGAVNALALIGAYAAQQHPQP